MTLTQAMVADSLPDADRDAAFSVFFFLGFLSAPFWAILVGVLMDAYGFNIAFGILAVSYIAEMALMLFATDPRNSSTGQPKSDATSAG